MKVFIGEIRIMLGFRKGRLILSGGRQPAPYGLHAFSST